MAPVLSVFVAVAAGVVLDKAGVACSAPALLAATTGVCLAAFAAVLFVRNVRRPSLGSGADKLGSHAVATVASCSGERELISFGGERRTFLRMAALYVAVSLAVVSVVFLLSIDGPSSFSRNDDTTVHLSLVRAFLDTGTFSTLNTSSYLDQGAEGGFYPAAWHVMVAMVASFFGNDVALATNAVMTVCIAVVFPLALCLLLARLFGSERSFVWAGALFAAGFSAFPWGFTVFGQLLPNMLSFMLVPLALTLLAGAVEAHVARSRAKLIALTAVAVVSVALSQPNGAFTFGIWAVLYGVSRIVVGPAGGGVLPSLRKRLALAAAVFAAACIVWVIMYRAPFMQAVVNTTWAGTLSPVEGLAAGLSFMFTVREGIQPFMSAMVLIGVVYTLRHRRYLWMSVAYAFALLLYFIDVSFDGPVKQLLSGFWYTDYYRTAAMTALFAIPLAAMGFACSVAFLRRAVRRVSFLGQGRRAFVAALGVMVVLYGVFQFFPLHAKLGGNNIYTGLMGIRHELADRYSWKGKLTSEEDAFVRKVMETVPEGALVINVPSDGSCWSYGVEGVNVYFRRSNDTGRGGAEQSALLRTKLADVATSEDVRQTLDEIDARYVLMLDDLSSDHRTTTSLRYKEENWRGIQAIDEDTPGFTLLLSEDDMRLYEITG